ncbi:sister chromatid cohesion protein PDS5 homolog B-like [Asparagus officinalis]|uniref:sister chromatid cohesion protein PDS5 homolog B-like n=1 Tax=Asparagus officinalis TaxID=4686 RepID=UPI00098DEDED|nr:sister chromatid cohesion protein PDS5 homolog B-like [Asparagus officinalis]
MPVTKKKISKLEAEAVVQRVIPSRRGKEPTTSSRKGKQIANSKESDEFETSSEEDETEGEAETDIPPSPVTHGTHRVSPPKSLGAPSKPIQMKEKTIPLSSSNKMTVRWPVQEEEEEEEEDVTPLISRKRSRSPVSSEAQPRPSQGTKLRMKFCHESSEGPRDARLLKRIKKTVHRQRKLPPLSEEEFTQDLPVDEGGGQEEEGEIVPEPSSPSLMDFDESSFTQ